MGLLESWSWRRAGRPADHGRVGRYTLNQTVVAQSALGPYVQDALDQIQYAIGPTSTH